MGARAQVYIKDEKVYLYTHWGAKQIDHSVKKVLSKKLRWKDPEYLARMIFSEMIKDDIERETGYGIGTSKHGDIEKLVTIDCKNQKIMVEDYEKKTKTYSFQKFVK